MKPFTTRFLLGVFVLLLAVLFSFGGIAQAIGTWKVVASPNPSKGYNGFTAVSAVSATDVWAVGYGSSETNPGLIEHWNGTKWSIVPTPALSNSTEYYLHGVAAVSANDVWVVGSYFRSSEGNEYTLIEHWNGTKWSIVSSPNPGATDNYLGGVAAVSKNDVWAVGWYANNSLQRQQVLTLHWNGTKWSVVASPTRNVEYMALSGLAVASASDIWGVGSYHTNTNQEKTLIEHWNGSAWSIVTSPNSTSPVNLLEAAAAVSSKDVWAVGYYSYDSGGYTQSKPLIEHWNGTIWSLVSAPGQSRSTLESIAVLSATDIWAVGGYSPIGQSGQTLIEHWNGTAWRLVSGPNPGSTDNRLGGVTRAPGTNTLWAAGTSSSDPNYSSISKTLTMYYA